MDPSYHFSRDQGVLLQRDADGNAQIDYRDTLNLDAAQELMRAAGEVLTLRRVSADQFDQHLTQRFQGAGDAADIAISELHADSDLAALAAGLEQPQDLLAAQDDAPIIRLLNALLSQAARENASDIHIEPFEQRLAVRFRVDGVLHDVLAPPPAIAPLLASRIKVMARLDIAEKRLPQDGRIAIRIGDRPIDLRVSTLPSGYGERVVLRLLDKRQGRLDLSVLGMADAHRSSIDAMIRRPHGLLLVTGPTGSGKTTTLYAALSRINDQSRNILTVEDPVEYFIDGIGQTQINTKVDMSFARGLRAILRQDPDVVMVGEMRDAETARIGVQASLTGHLVFSTLHTNTAAGAITRLRDMGIEPFLLASSLSGVLAQRLVRRLCAHCKRRDRPTQEEQSYLTSANQPQPYLYRAVGCAQCNGTGYAGRTGLYELLHVDDSLRQLIHDDHAESALRDHQQHCGESLLRDGLGKILAGETSLDEVIRVTTA